MSDQERRELIDYLERRIDHYEPYRPFLDSPEAKLVRKELEAVLEKLQAERSQS